MSRQYVQVRREGRVAIATLASPPHALMTTELVTELGALVGEVERDETIEAVVLPGAHPDRFLAHRLRRTPPHSNPASTLNEPVRR